MAQTKFGGQAKTFGKNTPSSFSAPGGGSGALMGPVKYEGSGGAGIARATTQGQVRPPAYSKEYGARLTKDQIGEIKIAEANFESRLADYQNQVDSQLAEAKSMLGKKASDVAKGKADAEKQLNKGRAELQKGKNKLQEASGALSVGGFFDYWWKNEDKVTVRVIGLDGKPQGGYQVPRSAITEGPGLGVKGTFHGKNNQFYNVSAEQDGRVVGQELHDALRNNTSKRNMIGSFASNPKVQKAMAKNQAEFNKAKRELAAAERELNKADAMVKQNVAKARGDIQKGQFEVKEGERSKKREVAGARKLAEGQKKNRAKAYSKWRDARRQAYQVLQKMEF